jgi:hypothetical protein
MSVDFRERDREMGDRWRRDRWRIHCFEVFLGNGGGAGPRTTGNRMDLSLAHGAVIGRLAGR